MNELTTDECFGLCEQLASLGTREVCLMGGEPFLRDDWFSVGQSVRDLGMRLTFVSNGTLLDKHLGKLTRLEPKVVGVSLDGMMAAHESIRGAGTWQPAVAAVKALASKGVECTVITTVSKLNYRDLPQLREVVLGSGANWQLQMATPFGNFKREQMLSPEEYYAVALFMEKERLGQRGRDRRVGAAHCFGYHSRLMPGYDWRGCEAGLSTIGVTSDGGIVGCLSMGNNRFIEGNIRDVSLQKIWDSGNSFVYNRRFDVADLGPNCADCRHGRNCKGGCNSTSYALTGRLHNNPYCLNRIEREYGLR